MIAETIQKSKPTRKTKKTRRVERPRLDPDCLYSRRDLMNMIGPHCHTFMRAYNNGHLEGHTIGRLVFHTGAQVLRWLEAGGKTN